MLFGALVRLLDPEPHPAAWNMAIDEVLLRQAKEPLLRCYRWVRPAVSFGYFGRYAEVREAWPEREHVRRWTGGGIVPHGDDFTYSLIVPRHFGFISVPAASSYRVIHEAVARALGAPGVVLAAEARAGLSSACFENPVRHDLIAGGRKVAGAAQRRTREGLLHQGSIQAPSLAPPLRLEEALAAALAPVVEVQPLAEATLAEAAELAAARYAASEWLWRA